MNPPDSRNGAPQTVKVLIVEGQMLVRQGLVSLINEADGLIVLQEAENVEQALRLCGGHQVDVFLLGLVTPDRATIDSVREIHGRFPRVKVVLLDEFVLDAHLRRALQLGVAGYMTKYDAFADIARALRRAAVGEQTFSPQVADRLVSTPRGLRLNRSCGACSLSSLTLREIEVLIHLAQGLPVKQCAEALQIRPSTVDNHKSRMMKKLKVHKTVDLTRLAIREGLAVGE